MKRLNHILIHALICCVLPLLLVACSGNKTTGTDSKGSTGKFTARERQDKNKILKGHDCWVSMHLEGKVMTLSETSYKLSGRGKKTMDGRRVDSFDARGNKTTSHFFDGADGEIVESVEVTKYDANDNDTVIYTYAADGSITHRNISTYDSRGNNVAIILYDRDENVEYTETYKYDSKDNLTELNCGPHPHRWKKWTFENDENGLITVGYAYDSIGNPMSKNVRKYDNKGNQVYDAAYQMDGVFIGDDSFKYDDKGHLMESLGEADDDRGTVLEKSVIKYDNKGHETEKLIYGLGGLPDDESSEYYENEYDATGNITRRTTFKMTDEKKVATAVTESVYAYY